MTRGPSARRSLTVAFLLFAAFLGLGYRLVVLHVGRPDALRDRVEHLRSYETKIVDFRGRIFDRHGQRNILALDLAVWDVVADPEVLIEGGLMEKATAQLAPILNMEPSDVMSRLDKPGRRYERLVRFADDITAERIRQTKLKGIIFEETAVRSYPLGKLGGHIIGFCNREGLGCAGVEQSMNGHLHGCPGLREGVLDGRRNEMFERRTQSIPAKEGADVYLTIDQRLQHAVERVLDETMQAHRAKAAWAIVQRVRTGEILAMASRPAYDPNEYNRATKEQLLNRTIGAVFDPGSTLKPVTIAAILEEGLVRDPYRTMIDCEHGGWFHSGRLLRDFHPYGMLSVADVVKKSSNIGTAKLAVNLLGPRKLWDWMHRFGIGEKAGIDLPGEEIGILHPVNKWSGISTSRIAIGQGVSVTAIQLLGMMCAIANDGVLMRPYIVREVEAKDGHVLYRREPEEVGRAISPKTAAVMRELLGRVTEEGGTGRRACVPGFKVAGKTGTAQKVIDGVYSETCYWASFVGFLPAEKPELGVIVVVDEPQPLHVGGLVAAPAFSAIAAEGMGLLNTMDSEVQCVAVLGSR